MHCVSSGESRFKLYRSDGLEFADVKKERYINACLRQTDGNVVPSIMIWGAFYFRDKSELVIVEAPMNQQVYQRVLR